MKLGVFWDIWGIFEWNEVDFRVNEAFSPGKCTIFTPMGDFR